MKNSNDTIWNRTSDLPICSADPTLKRNLKKRGGGDFVNTVISNVLLALECSLNQQMQSADDWCSGI